MDNLPISVTKDMEVNIIIIANISSAQPATPDQNQQPVPYYRDSPNEWYALFHNHLNPFKLFTIPNMDQVQQRLTSVLGVTRFQEVKTIDGALYTKLLSAIVARHSDLDGGDQKFQSSCGVAHEIVAQWG